jgi:hypothetical protein
MKSVKSEKLRTLEINKKLFFLGLASRNTVSTLPSMMQTKRKGRVLTAEKRILT